MSQHWGKDSAEETSPPIQKYGAHHGQGMYNYGMLWIKAFNKIVLTLDFRFSKV